MRSYLVLIPPNGPDRDHRSTLFLPDGFSWMALIFSWIWLIWHRLWLAGIFALVLQVAGALLMGMQGFWLGGSLLGFAIHVLVALEGRNHYANSLIRRGWTLESVISTTDKETAEEIYFSALPQKETQPLPSSADWAQANWDKTKQPPVSGWQGPALGLFDHGGR